MIDKSPALEQPYEVVSILRTKPPSGAEGSVWHQYVIAFEGNDSIRGYQPGNRSAVTSAVDELVARLNERHLGKRGRVNLVPGPKKNIYS